MFWYCPNSTDDGKRLSIVLPWRHTRALISIGTGSWHVVPLMDGDFEGLPIEELNKRADCGTIVSNATSLKVYFRSADQLLEQVRETIPPPSGWN